LAAADRPNNQHSLARLHSPARLRLRRFYNTATQ
jgi:hypothetical protein